MVTIFVWWIVCVSEFDCREVFHNLSTVTSHFDMMWLSDYVTQRALIDCHLQYVTVTTHNLKWLYSRSTPVTLVWDVIFTCNNTLHKHTRKIWLYYTTTVWIFSFVFVLILTHHHHLNFIFISWLSLFYRNGDSTGSKTTVVGRLLHSDQDSL